MLLFSGEGKDVTVAKEMTDTWKETTLHMRICLVCFIRLYQKKFSSNLKCTGGKHSKIRVTELAAANKKSDKCLSLVN